MQLANQINARKIYDEAVLFDGLFTNRVFLSIWSSECLLQVNLSREGNKAKGTFVQFLIVQYGRVAFQTSPLDLKEWLVCIGFGALALPIRECIRRSNSTVR